MYRGKTKQEKCIKLFHVRVYLLYMYIYKILYLCVCYTYEHAIETDNCRQRRDLSNLLRVPGTKWCGKGWTAKKYTDLGGLSKADRCCRQHDKACPFWIMGFETKYSFFNFRVNTLMHCKCDER